jgi:hypothetical protein
MSTISGSDIGDALIGSLGGQSDLLSSLSLATIGGLLAFAIQVMLHNASTPDKPIGLQWLWTWWGCIILEFGSISSSYLLKGSIVAAIPTIFGTNFIIGQPIQENKVPALDNIQFLALIQFGCFILGILLLVAFLFRNSMSLRK